MLRSTLFFLLLILISVSVIFGGEKSEADKKKESIEIQWSTLTEVKLERDGEDFMTLFSKKILDLKNKKVRVKGFMIPLEAAAKHKEFILSALPASHCFFCGGGGPTRMVEVFATDDIDYTSKMIILEGTFKVIEDNPYGLLYQLQSAKVLGIE